MNKRNVLITGGTRGIGAATARKFAMNNCKVILIYHSDESAAQRTLLSLKGEGHMIYQADISDVNQVEDLFAYISTPIDVLVNSAGIAIPNSIDQDRQNWKESWNRTLGLNLTGLANCCYYASQNMKENRSGSIVNVSSRGAFRGEPDMLAYGASKGAVNSLTQSLAKALGEYNIGVTAVAPGFVDTDMAASILNTEDSARLIAESPFGRIAQPEEVADAIYFLSLPSSLFMSGTILDVNGASFLRM